MPGTRLSQTEKKLLTKWSNPKSHANYLRSIHISPIDTSLQSSGLRGIVNAQIEFSYPVTVLVGPNGSGKSTILSLAALAFRGDTHVPPGRTMPGYRFPDFFFAVRGETQPTNFTISWNIHTRGGKERTTKMVRRSTQKWMDYGRRHQADVVHIGLTRINSWSESAPHKRAFIAEKTLKPVPHDGWITNAMSSIFSRPYSASTSMSVRKYLMPQVSTASGGTYSGFNMGTGEAAVIAILEEISRCPKGSMILIEEIEMAIHPSAQTKLAQVLLERAESHDLQIICTSHSRWFIDALPRQARILIQPSENEHICMSNVTTRLAEGALLGKHQEELLVICEDAVGQMIIESALTMEQRNRVKIVPCGSKSELGRAATYSHLMHPTLPILIVWDGDATASNIKEALNAADGGKHLLSTDLIQWTRIGGVEIMSPGHRHLPTDAPEYQIKKTILEDTAAQERAALAFGTERHKVQIMLEGAAVEEKSHHRLFDDVVNKTGTSLEHVGRTLSGAYVNSLRNTSGKELPLVDAVSSMLNGARAGFAQPWNDDGDPSSENEAA